MLNYTNQPSTVLFDDVTLTTSYGDNRQELETGGFSKLALNINYERGSGEAASKLQMTVEASDDNVEWYSLVIDDTSTTSIISQRVWEVEDSAKLNVLLDIAYKNVRVSVQESGVSSTAGTVTVKATRSGL